MRVKTGVYGAAVNLAMLLAGLLPGITARGEFEPEFRAVFSALLIVSAFVVYAFIVSRYVGKREKPGRVLVDSLVGMLAELMVVTLAAVLAGVALSAAVFFAQGGAAFISALGYNIILSLLWIFGSYLLPVLIGGNVAGVLGWYLLDKAGVRPG